VDQFSGEGQFMLVREKDYCECRGCTRRVRGGGVRYAVGRVSRACLHPVTARVEVRSGEDVLPVEGGLERVPADPASPPRVRTGSCTAPARRTGSA
jgi:hypothetical protein